MKIIAKTKAVLFSNKAETMVEVTVAFMVLSIIMALFAQRIMPSTGAGILIKLLRIFLIRR